MCVRVPALTPSRYRYRQVNVTLPVSLLSSRSVFLSLSHLSVHNSQKKQIIFKLSAPLETLKQSHQQCVQTVYKLCVDSEELLSL